jgi:carbonic anhydrase
LSTKKLTDGYKSFQNEFNKNRELFLNLANKGQHPKVLWIGCSDSRVIPEQIMGANPGELFIHRNIANIIPPKNSKENCTNSVLEYAINALHITDIVICGHTECGGIKAVLNISQTSEDSAINNWLKYALPAKYKIFSNNTDEKSYYLETIKQNVLLQKEHLLSYDYIKNKYQSENLSIHTWLYDLHLGKIFSYDPENKFWINLA